ncbi:hypothetical protein HYQ45_010719 [Verticillium longisporum]|uniref:CCD97-like C-terminal domain-containing protein n=1 Tax=Verticillium longisporum TaxID=100787 RepID=A0A8I3ALX3_VERLO|nr:hypothetical protein HYQ45_010719 [Verticillium longisporum]
MPYVMSATPEPGSHPPSSSLALDKPMPRPPKSDARTREIRTQNRRRHYLVEHPEYLSSTEHELADPVLYEKLVRQYQTPAEREAEGKRKGYSRVLEGDLLRGEARMAEIAQSTADPSASSPVPPAFVDVATVDVDLTASADKDEARERWHQFLTRRFVHGQDDDFDYDKVDFNEGFDVLERRTAEDAWFEDEEPGWASDRESGDPEEQQPAKSGETGIQDF